MRCVPCDRVMLFMGRRSHTSDSPKGGDFRQRKVGEFAEPEVTGMLLNMGEEGRRLHSLNREKSFECPISTNGNGTSGRANRALARSMAAIS